MLQVKKLLIVRPYREAGSASYNSSRDRFLSGVNVLDMRNR